jgi:hypothetical protein
VGRVKGENMKVEERGMEIKKGLNEKKGEVKYGH